MATPPKLHEAHSSSCQLPQYVSKLVALYLVVHQCGQSLTISVNFDIFYSVVFPLLFFFKDHIKKTFGRKICSVASCTYYAQLVCNECSVSRQCSVDRIIDEIFHSCTLLSVLAGSEQSADAAVF